MNAKDKGYEIKDDSEVGLRIRVWGLWTMSEAESFVEEVKSRSQSKFGSFMILIDALDFPVQKADVAARIMASSPQKYGILKIAFVVSTMLLVLQARKCSQESSFHDIFRIFGNEFEAMEWLGE